MTSRRAFVAAYALLFLFTAFQSVRRVYTLKTDYDGFWRAGRAVLDGHDPYERIPGPEADRLMFPGLRKTGPVKLDDLETDSAVTRYLPFFGILMAPFALLPMDASCLLWHCFSFAALLFSLKCAFRLSGRERPLDSGDALAVLIATAVFWADAFTMGQIGIVTLALSLAAVDLARTRPWIGGALAGLAAAIKVTPAIVGVYFLMKRRWAAAAACAAAFVLLCALAVPVWGASRSRELHERWLSESASTTGSRFFELRESVRYNNQSLHAWAARVFMDVNAGKSSKPFQVNLTNLSPGTVAWIVRALQLPLAILCLLAFLARRNGEAMSLPEAGLLCAVTTFVSPVAWTFHLAVILPSVVCLLDRRQDPEFRRWLFTTVLLELGIVHPWTRAIGLPMFACLAATLGAWRAAMKDRAALPTS
ncbi:MAG: glycosyltransferase family 87 protein [Planctomycetota bacterium]